MGKATQRRERRQVRFLRDLLARNPELFKRAWEHRIRVWVMEVYARGVVAVSATAAMEDRQPIFGVLAKAERMLDLCGEEAQRLVAAQTRAVVENECCKVVARITDARLYRLANMESNRDLMRAGTHRPPR